MSKIPFFKEKVAHCILKSARNKDSGYIWLLANDTREHKDKSSIFLVLTLP